MMNLLEILAVEPPESDSSSVPIAREAIELIEYLFKNFDLTTFYNSVEPFAALLAIALSAPIYEIIRRYFQRFEITNFIKFTPSSKNDRKWVVSIKNNSRDLLDLDFLIYTDQFQWNEDFKVIRRNENKVCRNIQISGNRVILEGFFPKAKIDMKITTAECKELVFLKIIKDRKLN